jgi:hypothetical protein
MTQQNTLVPHVLRKKLDGSNFSIKKSSEKIYHPHPGAPNLAKKNQTPICRFVTMGLYGNFRESSNDDSRKKSISVIS